MANDDISLEVRAGELHCLLGENGAGKSTLSNCIYGLQQPDEGRILVDGEPVVMQSPADAIRRGIGVVHQHFVLVGTFTVLENIVVGTGSGWWLRQRSARARVEELCRRYGLTVDIDARAEELSVGGQQWIEIVKALYLGVRLLVLDEPTAVLTPQESERLFIIMREMTANGLSIILITHKMTEVMQSDRVSVLRKGRLVSTVDTRLTTREDLARMMIGRRLVPIESRAGPPVGPAALELEGIGLVHAGHAALQNINLSVRGGEIVGIAGIAGNGQSEIFELIAGLRSPSRGRIRLDGRDITGYSPKEIAALGLGHIPADRFRDGLVADFSIAENLVLGQQWQERWRRGLALDRRRMAGYAETCIAAFSIVASGTDAPLAQLSGGNAQKVILAREIGKATRCLLCNQPTRGLDIGIIDYVHRELLRMRDAGLAILLASEELDDLLNCGTSAPRVKSSPERCSPICARAICQLRRRRSCRSRWFSSAADRGGGALLGGLAGLLKTRFKVDEVISTVMLNYIIVYALSLMLLHGPWTEAGGFFAQIAQVETAARLPLLLEQTRLHLGFLVALLAAVVLHFIVDCTPLGYEMRAASSNLRALEFQDVKVARLVLVAMALSGAVAGLAGATEIYGVQYRLKSGVLDGLGYTGIIVAILGQLNPKGVVVAAILFGALLNGATLMQIVIGVPAALIYAV